MNRTISKPITPILYVSKFLPCYSRARCAASVTRDAAGAQTAGPIAAVAWVPRYLPPTAVSFAQRYCLRWRLERPTPTTRIDSSGMLVHMFLEILLTVDGWLVWFQSQLVALIVFFFSDQIEKCGVEFRCFVQCFSKIGLEIVIPLILLTLTDSSTNLDVRKKAWSCFLNLFY